MVSILYYYGAMQWIIKKLGCMLQMIIGTTLIESVSVAANIFLGMTESPLVIRPYLKVSVCERIRISNQQPCFIEYLQMFLVFDDK